MVRNVVFNGHEICDYDNENIMDVVKMLKKIYYNHNKVEYDCILLKDAADIITNLLRDKSVAVQVLTKGASSFFD